MGDRAVRPSPPSIKYTRLAQTVVLAIRRNGFVPTPASAGMVAPLVFGVDTGLLLISVALLFIVFVVYLFFRRVALAARDGFDEGRR